MKLFLFSIRYLIVLFILTLITGPNTTQAQVDKRKDGIADYEIPYIVGKAQELTLRLVDDLNSLHANIPEDAKGTVYSYIYDAFEEKENARVLSDLDYSRPLESLENRNPISISKYALDYEVDAEISQILVPVSDFKFTFPEYAGNYQYELYGSFSQYFIGLQGDTLIEHPFVKLASYVATRDSVTKRFNLKLRSIVFLDRQRQPDFMLDEELVGMTQKYFEWKNSGASIENIEMMSDEAIQETLRKAKEKRDSKEAMLNAVLATYDMAKIRGDVIGTAEEFVKAEKLQRSNPILLKDKLKLSEEIKSKVAENFERATSALNAWNYTEAVKLVEENEKALGLWSQMNNRRFDDLQKYTQLYSEVTTAADSWNDNQRKVDNEIFRKKFKSELIETINSVNCADAGKNDNLARKYFFLGKIAEIEKSEPADIYYLKAMDCRSEFAYPKWNLVKTKKESALGYLDDLIYFEPKNPNYFLGRARLYMANGEFSKAESDLVEALKYDPNNKDALLRLAAIQIQNQEYAAALQNLDNNLYLYNDPEAAIFAAYASLESKDEFNPQAKAYVKQYSNGELSMQSMRTLDSLMTIYQQQTIHHRKTTLQDYEAAKYFEKMYVLGNHIPQYYTEWGYASQCYYDMGNEGDNYDSAILFANAAIEQSNGKSENGLRVKGLVSRELENYSESKESLYKLLEIKNDYDSNFELGETFFAEGRELITARTYYENALERLGKKKDKEKFFLIHKRIGQCYRKEMKYELSEDQMKEAIKSLPKKGEGYFELGLTYLSNPDESKINKAFNYFEDAEHKGFDAYKVLSATALAQFRMRDYRKAKKTFEQIRFKYESSITLDDLLIEARTFIALDDLKEASENLKALVARNNQFANTANYNVLQGFIALKKAASSSISQEVKVSELQRAKTNFEEAVKLDITYPDSYLGLSIAEFNLDKENAALGFLDKAINLRIEVEQYEDDSKFTNFFNSKSVKKKLKTYEKSK